MIRQICTIDNPDMYDDKPYMYEDNPYMYDDIAYMYDDIAYINDDMTYMYEYHIHVWYHVIGGENSLQETITSFLQKN